MVESKQYQYQFVATLLLFVLSVIVPAGKNRLPAVESDEVASTTNTAINIITAKTWEEFRRALENTWTENGYPLTIWRYLGSDAKYQYAVNPASTVLRLSKGLAPRDRLWHSVQEQCQRQHDLEALGDLDLPWTQYKYSDAFCRWCEEAHLDTSLLDQAERALLSSARLKGRPSGDNGSDNNDVMEKRTEAAKNRQVVKKGQKREERKEKRRGRIRFIREFRGWHRGEFRGG